MGVDYDDIYWYFTLAGQMHESVGRSFTFISFGKSNQHISCCIYLESLFRKNEGFIFTDKKLEAYSCYVELHSHPVGINGRNNIVVMTPMKFLPIEEFEKRQ